LEANGGTVIVAAEEERIKARRKGCYVLILALDHPADIAVGKLGLINFPVGKYAYTGSALGGLDARIARHFRSEKTVHWHIDYLLQEGRPLQAHMLEGEGREECWLNGLVDSLAGARRIAPGFGSSDCRCETHLHRMDKGALASLAGIFEYHDHQAQSCPDVVS
jgi:Uri superfamily endonuclease